MTERTGGSDVANSETIAIPQKDGSYLLHGYKFFTSATTSAMAVVLARIVDENGKGISGSRGLSCFILPMKRDPVTDTLPGIIVHQLKEKLGTKAVPTAGGEERRKKKREKD
jgi:alkylation response protein AidB-like acyl-CoA dehydrogenase